MLVEVIERASISPEGEGSYLFGCDWPGCEATVECPGERASEAAYHLKKHGAWGSRSTPGLYCEVHTPLAVERERRLAAGKVVAPLDAATLLEQALSSLEGFYLFGEDAGYGEYTRVGAGIAAFEAGGRKYLLTCHDVTESHKQEVLGRSETDSSGGPK